MSITVEVEDNGPGIPENEHEKIFDKFYRGNNVKDRTKGTGVGFYISKTLIESMGGAISLQNNRAEGACFSVVFTL